MITENDPMLPRKVDLEKNPSGTELKIAQHRELELHVALFMDTIGLLLLGIGLFSSQWICFLVVLIMSFSQIQKLGAWAVFLDSLVTVIIYAFAILNAYHLA